MLKLKAQNTLEYILLVAIAVIVVVAGADAFFGKLRAKGAAFNHVFDNMRARIGVHK